VALLLLPEHNGNTLGEGAAQQALTAPSGFEPVRQTASLVNAIRMRARALLVLVGRCSRLCVCTRKRVSFLPAPRPADFVRADELSGAGSQWSSIFLPSDRSHLLTAEEFAFPSETRASGNAPTGAPGHKPQSSPALPGPLLCIVNEALATRVWIRDARTVQSPVAHFTEKSGYVMYTICIKLMSTLSSAWTGLQEGLRLTRWRLFGIYQRGASRGPSPSCEGSWQNRLATAGTKSFQ
jgi:hypothetical protein